MVARTTTRHRPTWLAVGVPLALIALLVLGAREMLILQERAIPADEDLVNDLVEIEDAVGDLPLMADVAVAEDDTWGTVRGDHVGARITLDEVDSALADLVDRASRSETAVGQAVTDVAVSYRTMREGYTHLEAYEEAGLIVALEEDDEDDGDDDITALGQEEARGHAEVGLRLLLEALAGFHRGYDILRDAAASGAAQTLFELRYDDVEAAAQDDGHRARILLSYPSTEVLVPVARFEGTDPATSTRYACVDRETWTHARPGEPVPSLPVPEGEQRRLPYPDCPDLDLGGLDDEPISP